MNKLLKSKTFKTVAVTIGVILAALLIFASGVHVGLRKARFSYKFADNYERNFAGPQRNPMGFFRDMDGRGFRNPHGTAGKIVSINENSIVIKDRDDRENTVTVSDRTIIKKAREDIKIGDLKNDDELVVIGRPGDDGVINADLIRVFDRKN